MKLTTRRAILTQLSACLAIASYAMLNANVAYAQDANRDDGKLRIICFGAHPDDAEYKSGGSAALWAKQGHHVKLVSVTNGDIGHWQMSGGALAQRRAAEVRKAAEILGITTEVMDVHD